MVAKFFKTIKLMTVTSFLLLLSRRLSSGMTVRKRLNAIIEN